MSFLNLTIHEIKDAIAETDIALNESEPRPKGERKRLLELRMKKLKRVKNMRIEFIANIALPAKK